MMQRSCGFHSAGMTSSVTPASSIEPPCLRVQLAPYAGGKASSALHVLGLLLCDVEVLELVTVVGVLLVVPMLLVVAHRSSFLLRMKDRVSSLAVPKSTRDARAGAQVSEDVP